MNRKNINAINRIKLHNVHEYGLVECGGLFTLMPDNPASYTTSNGQLPSSATLIEFHTNVNKLRF